MARIASIVGLKAGNWVNISCGPATEQRATYKQGNYPGFDRVLYMDSSGGTKRKKGQPVSATSPAKGKAGKKAKGNGG
tara:strand:+ start:717 stop:950 length:234 start_codon:yes stop_codon:yes gene_type:complete